MVVGGLVTKAARRLRAEVEARTDGSFAETYKSDAAAHGATRIDEQFEPVTDVEFDEETHTGDAYLHFLLSRILRTSYEPGALEQLDKAVRLEKIPSRKRAWINLLVPEAIAENRRDLAAKHLRGLAEPPDNRIPSMVPSSISISKVQKLKLLIPACISTHLGMLLLDTFILNVMFWK